MYMYMYICVCIYVIVLALWSCIFFLEIELCPSSDFFGGIDRVETDAEIWGVQN